MHRVISHVLGFLLLLALAFTGASQPIAASTDGLAVESLLPQGRVDRITQIVVSFDKDMRRLGDMSQTADSAPLSSRTGPVV